MKTKILEIRDRGTMIAALCIDMNPENEIERAYLRRYGYPCDGRPNIMVTHATGGKVANNDPYDWRCRTWGTAHLYIIEHWAGLKDGDVVDVEFILGETKFKKTSEVLP